MFTPRTTIPDKNNPYYIARKDGGLNPCIPKPSGSSLQFANCVFYAVGRFAEICGIWMRSTNAENFVTVANEMGLAVSQKPKLGAIAVWSKGVIGNGSDGAGHVAVVEIINGNEIVTSESGWSAKQAFWTSVRKNNGNWGQPASYKFLGFILPKGAAPAPLPVLKKGDKGDSVKQLQQKLIAAGYLRSSELDGDFGKITLGALLAFQLEHGLKVDGVCGPETMAALFA